MGIENLKNISPYLQVTSAEVYSPFEQMPAIVFLRRYCLPFSFPLLFRHAKIKFKTPRQLDPCQYECMKLYSWEKLSGCIPMDVNKNIDRIAGITVLLAVFSNSYVIAARDWVTRPLNCDLPSKRALEVALYFSREGGVKEAWRKKHLDGLFSPMKASL